MLVATKSKVISERRTGVQAEQPRERCEQKQALYWTFQILLFPIERRSTRHCAPGNSSQRLPNLQRNFDGEKDPYDSANTGPVATTRLYNAQESDEQYPGRETRTTPYMFASTYCTSIRMQVNKPETASPESNARRRQAAIYDSSRDVT